MTTHKQAADAHVRAQTLTDNMKTVQERAARSNSIFTAAYAEAKGREARAAMLTARALSLWACWSVPQELPASFRRHAREER